MSNTHDGGCACGERRYRLEARPIVVHACHCRFCQRMSGSAFGLNGMIEAKRLTLLGDVEPEAVQTPSARPEGQVWYRCPHCQVALWSYHPDLGARVPIVNLGTLDRPEAIVPDVHCWTARKHPWIALPEGLPAYPGDYDSDAVWSEEAKARIAAALA